MRRFLLVTHEARTAPDFPLEDLPGFAGRMDLVARCVAASLLVSYGIRKDVELLVMLQGPPGPPRLVRFLGAEVRSLNPDERSTAALIRKALAADPSGEEAVHPGVYATQQSLVETLAGIPDPVVLLAEDGEDLRENPLPRDAAFILSDHKDFTAEERAQIRSRAKATRSVGPVSLQADQVIAVVNNELDRRR